MCFGGGALGNRGRILFIPVPLRNPIPQMGNLTAGAAEELGLCTRHWGRAGGPQCSGDLSLTSPVPSASRLLRDLTRWLSQISRVWMFILPDHCGQKGDFPLHTSGNNYSPHNSFGN